MIIMTLLQLQYFKVLAKVLHYTNAALELHISQPSLSYAIAELEKELGVALFTRKNRKMVLTAYGVVFLEYVNQALETIDESVAKIHAMKKGDSGEVSIGYIYSTSASIIPEIVEEFKRSKENDNISFKFTQNLQHGLIESLKNGDIDLAITASTDEAVVSVPLMEQELFLIVSKKNPLAKLKTVKLEEIAKEPFILLDEDSSLRVQLNKQFAKIKVDPHILSEAPECNTALQYVAHNSGVTILPHTPGIAELPVKQIKISTPGFTRQIYLSWINAKTPMPPVRKVRNFILNMFNIKN
jgi:DNA-binding transcriptional LysR family regulator